MSVNPLFAKPDMPYLMSLIRRGALLMTNVHVIGTVQTFDPVTRLVQATSNYTRIVNGNAAAYPTFAGCPIIVLQGGGGHITFKVSPGDTCLILFNDANMDRWLSSGNAGAPPNDTRSHSFSDAIVLVGLDSIPGAQAKDYFADGAEFGQETDSGLTAIQLTETIKLFNAVTDLKTVLDGLINAIKAITTLNSDSTTGVVSAASQTALEAYKSTIAGLLT